MGANRKVYMPPVKRTSGNATSASSPSRASCKEPLFGSDLMPILTADADQKMSFPSLHAKISSNCQLFPQLINLNK